MAERAAKKFKVDEQGPVASGLPPVARTATRGLVWLAFKAANKHCDAHGLRRVGDDPKAGHFCLVDLRGKFVKVHVLDHPSFLQELVERGHGAREICASVRGATTASSVSPLLCRELPRGALV